MQANKIISTPDIPLRDVMKVSRFLENHDVIFHQFWELGKPVFTESIKTACVSFNKEGQCINFLFNPTFWGGLTDYQRSFIVAHECLHVFLNHGVRSIEEKDKKAANVALDIAVNHTLINNFGFELDKLESLSTSLCFVDTVFGSETEIQDDENFEFYMAEIKKNPNIVSKFQTIDSHEFLNSFGSEEDIRKILEKAIKSNRLSPESLNEFLNKNKKQTNDINAGNASWVDEIICQKKLVKQKKTWLKVIRKILHKHCNMVSQERWGMYDHRRNSVSQLLPAEKIILDSYNQKVKIAMFLDSSGSCYDLAETFFRASESIPRDFFDVDLFSFDTSVHSISKDRKIKGGGGTSFNCINNHIKSYKKIFDLVFVITDGYGGRFSCEKPKDWVWFLSTKYKSDIPEGSRIYDLGEFYDD
jgi:predicted metal-dependent peptidase